MYRSYHDWKKLIKLNGLISIMYVGVGVYVFVIL